MKIIGSEGQTIHAVVDASMDCCPRDLWSTFRLLSAPIIFMIPAPGIGITETISSAETDNRSA